MMMAWRDREGWLNFVFLGDGRVEHKKERDQRRWGKSSWGTGTWRIGCAGQLTIPDTRGTSPDRAQTNTHTRSSLTKMASRTPDFSYPLVSSMSFSSSSPISLFPVHNSTVIAEHKVKWSLSISQWHDHELTPSTAYTEYSIHRVQHTPSTAYTEYSIHPRLFVFASFSWLRVDQWMLLQLPAYLPTRSTAISQLSMWAQR